MKETLVRLKVLLTTGRVRQLAHFARDRLAEINIAEVASSMALATLLAIVPVLALSLAVFAAFPSFSGTREALENLIVTSFLPEQYSGVLIRYLRDFADHAAGLTTFGLIGLAVTALMMIDKLFVTVNRLFKVRTARPLMQRVLIYWALLTVGPVAIAVSITLTGQATARALAGVDAGTSAVLLSFGQFALQVAGYAALYKCIPNCRVPWTNAFVGGFAAAGAGFIVKVGFEYYVTAGTLTNIYGAFVALPVLVLWIYVAWFLFFAGAAVTATIPKLTSGRYMDSYRAGDDFLTALAMVKALTAKYRESDQPVMTLTELCRAADACPEAALKSLEGLAHAGYAAPAATGEKDDAWVLTVDPHRAVLLPLFREFCIDPRSSLVASRVRNAATSGILNPWWLRLKENSALTRPMAEVL